VFCLEVRFTHFRCVGAKRDASEMTLFSVQGSGIFSHREPPDLNDLKVTMLNHD